MKKGLLVTIIVALLSWVYFFLDPNLTVGEFVLWCIIVACTGAIGGTHDAVC